MLVGFIFVLLVVLYLIKLHLGITYASKKHSSFVRWIRNRCMWNIAPSNMYWSEAGSVWHPNVFLDQLLQFIFLEHVVFSSFFIWDFSLNDIAKGSLGWGMCSEKTSILHVGSVILYLDMELGTNLYHTDCKFLIAQEDNDVYYTPSVASMIFE